MLGDQTLPERFWRKVRVDEASGCWLWRAAITHKGYGQFYWQHRMRSAHRVAYEALVGPVPVGLELDHTCSTRNCANPKHLEPVTHLVNVQRGRLSAVMAAKYRNRTHCRRGHELTRENTKLWRGQKRCRECYRVNQRERNERARSRTEAQ